MVDRRTTENISDETVKEPMDDLEIQSIADTIDSQSFTEDDEENLTVSDHDHSVEDQAITNEPAPDMDIPEYDQSLITDSSDTSMIDDDDDDDDDIEDLISVDNQSIAEADKIPQENAVDQPAVVSDDDIEESIPDHNQSIVEADKIPQENAVDQPEVVSDDDIEESIPVDNQSIAEADKIPQENAVDQPAVVSDDDIEESIPDHNQSIVEADKIPEENAVDQPEVVSDDDIEESIPVDNQSIEEADKILEENAVDQPEVVSEGENVENEINNDPSQPADALPIDENIGDVLSTDNDGRMTPDMMDNDPELADAPTIDDEEPEKDASMTSESETTMDDDGRLTAVTVDSDMDVESLNDNEENLMNNNDEAAENPSMEAGNSNILASDHERTNELVPQPDDENVNTASMDHHSEVSSIENDEGGEDMTDASDDGSSEVTDNDDEENASATTIRENIPEEQQRQTPNIQSVEPIATPSSIDKNDDAKNLVDDNYTLPLRSPANEEINMNSMPKKEKSNISSMIGSDTSLPHSPTADRQSPAKLTYANQTPVNMSVDKEKSSLVGNNDDLARTMNDSRSTRPSIVISRKPSFAASANLTLTNMSIDEENLPLLDNNEVTVSDVVLNNSRSTRPSIATSRKPSFAASANRTLANMSIDEESTSLLDKNDLTLRDVVLNGSRPSIVTSQKPSFAASPNQNMSISNRFYLPDEVLTRNSQGAIETNVHDKSVSLRLNNTADNSMIGDETFEFDDQIDLDQEDTDSLTDADSDISTITLEKENTQNVSGSERPEKLSAPIEHNNDLLTSLPLNIEMTRNLTVNIEKSDKSPISTERRMSPLETSAQGRLLQPDERQKSNMSSGSSVQRSILSRRNTEHTIVDLSKVANVPAAPEKAALTKLSSTRRSVVILDHRLENTMQSPARRTSLSLGKENFRPLLNSTDAEGLMENAEKSPSFLASRVKSDSIDGSFDVTNDNESIDKFDIENETIDSIKYNMVRSCTNAPPRKTPRLSFIDNAHIIQINSSKESHMRALPAEKFWRRNQRRVSTVPSAETGQAAPT